MIRFAGMAVAFALTACGASFGVHDSDAEVGRRRAAGRHVALSLAYLEMRRLDVAEVEASAARRLLPGDLAVLHASALVDVAAGRHASALRRFAAAVAVGDAGRQGDGKQRNETVLADEPALWSNYAQALCVAGHAAEAAVFYERVHGPAAPAAEAVGEQCRQAS